MMPGVVKPAPARGRLKTCIEAYRAQATGDGVGVAWRRFRASACGKAWFEALCEVYGHRCQYCDHAHARSVDHCHAKSVRVEATFAWENFRASCLDCNHQKGTRAIVDPLQEDPRKFVEYDVSTGKPAPSHRIVPVRRKRAEATICLLDFQTLNEARRAKCRRLVEVLRRFLSTEPGYDRQRVLQELRASEPHRAIVRDLVLGAESDLHQWSPLIRAAIRAMPELKTWALDPVHS